MIAISGDVSGNIVRRRFWQNFWNSDIKCVTSAMEKNIHIGYKKKYKLKYLLYLKNVLYL